MVGPTGWNLLESDKHHRLRASSVAVRLCALSDLSSARTVGVDASGKTPSTRPPPSPCSSPTPPARARSPTAGPWRRWRRVRGLGAATVLRGQASARPQSATGGSTTSRPRWAAARRAIRARWTVGITVHGEKSISSEPPRAPPRGRRRARLRRAVESFRVVGKCRATPAVISSRFDAPRLIDRFHQMRIATSRISRANITTRAPPVPSRPPRVASQPVARDKRADTLAPGDGDWIRARHLMIVASKPRPLPLRTRCSAHCHPPAVHHRRQIVSIPPAVALPRRRCEPGRRPEGRRAPSPTRKEGDVRVYFSPRGFARSAPRSARGVVESLEVERQYRRRASERHLFRLDPSASPHLAHGTIPPR